MYSDISQLQQELVLQRHRGLFYYCEPMHAIRNYTELQQVRSLALHALLQLYTEMPVLHLYAFLYGNSYINGKYDRVGLSLAIDPNILASTC